MMLRDSYAAIMAALALAWAVPDQVTVSQWADAERVLSAESSSEPGPWRTSRNSLLREPMDALSDHMPAAEVSVMFASQLGKSEIGNNWVGYVIRHCSGPMLFVEPTILVMERYSKQRIEPMIAASPQLRERVPAAGKRDGGNTLMMKEWPGGVLVMGGANSSSSLASMPIKRLWLDEMDRYQMSLGAEGSTSKQAEQRLVTFARSKQLNVSTPVRMPLDDDDQAGSQIWRKYQAGSRAQYHVPCSHCGGLQPLLFEHLRWEKGVDERGQRVHRTETAVYMCQASGCGEAIAEHHKPSMLLEVQYGGQARWVHERPWLKDTHATYKASALYSPIGLGRSWREIADEWLEACRDRSKLVTFWNLILGLPFDDHADRMSDQDLADQAEDYQLGTVPRGYYLLSGSVDTQPDRLEYLVRAWGPHERSIVVRHTRIPGDPEGPEVWAELTRLRHATYVNACGIPLRVSLTAIDTGGANTHAVYRYCRDMRSDGVIPVKGANVRKGPIIGKPSKKEVRNSKGDYAKYGLALWMVGTDTAKEVLFARLGDWRAGDETPERRMVRLAKGLGGEFFRQLTAEVYDPHTGLWKKLRERNEALDLMVYSHAAACHPSMRVDRMTAADWDYLASVLEPHTPDLFAPAAAAAPAPAAPAEPDANAAGEGPADTAAPQDDAQAQAITAPADPAPAPIAPPAAAPVASPSPDQGWLSHTDGWLD